MEQDYDEKFPKIIELISKQLKIKPYELCFCGSGKKFKKCCRFKSREKALWMDEPLEKFYRYKDSQGGNIEKIPTGLWNPLYKRSINSFECLYPNCKEKTSECHLIPRNLLAREFGGHCLEYDPIERSFAPEGTNSSAGVCPVFCNKHDSSIFSPIDLEVDWESPEHLFLLCFKSIPFSLRKIQALLKMDSQLELYRPQMIVAKEGFQSHVEIDLSHLHEQYLRFKNAYFFFENAVLALEKKNWDFFDCFHREVDSQDKLFFADWINPSHDLDLKRLTIPNVATALTCTVFSREGKLNAVLGVPLGSSRKAYNSLIEQITEINDAKFKCFLNNLMLVASNSPLLSVNAVSLPTHSDLRHAKMSLKSSLKRGEPFDLNAVRNGFI